MTTLTQASYPRMAAFFNEIFYEMSRQGVSTEQIDSLLAAPKRLQHWVSLLPETTPSTGNLLIAELFSDDTALVNILTREDITTLGDLTDCTADEVRKIWQLGTSKFQKITAVLEAHDLQYSEALDNGARRIPYGDPYDKRTVRRDRIRNKPIAAFIRIEKDPTRNQRHRESMTIDEFRAADTDTHRRLFTDVEIDRISNWIVTHVR